MRSCPRAVLAASVAGVCLATPGVGLAQPIATAVLTDIPGLPTSQAAGTPGYRYDSFWDHFPSPDGTKWILNGDVFGAGSEHEVIVVGEGTSFQNAEVVLIEGQPAPWGPGTIDVIYGRTSINDNGDFAFSVTLAGVPADADEQVVRFNATTQQFEVVVQEGDEVPGFPGNVFASRFGSASIINDGTVGYHALFTVGDLFTNEDEFVILGDTVIAQEGVTVPNNTTAAWQLFDRDRCYFSADGAQYLIHGQLELPVLGDATIVDDMVVIVEDEVIPGSGFTEPVDFANPQHSLMTQNGDWFSRGHNDDDQDWVVRNGEVIAATGWAVPGTNGEYVWSDNRIPPYIGTNDTFFAAAGNNRGDFVVGGYGEDTKGDIRFFYVLNNEQIIARMDDPVDVDADGDLDNYFLGQQRYDEMMLTNTDLYFTVVLKNQFGQFVSSAFVSVPLPIDECLADMTTQGAGSGDPGFGVPDGQVTAADLNYYVNAYVAGDTTVADVTTQGAGPGDPDFGVPDGQVTGADINFYVNLWVAGCP